MKSIKVTAITPTTEESCWMPISYLESKRYDMLTKCFERTLSSVSPESKVKFKMSEEETDRFSD